MRLLKNIIGIQLAGVLLGTCFWAGCASSDISTRKRYDQLAKMVAERNGRQVPAKPAATAPASGKTSKSSAAPAKPPAEAAVAPAASKPAPAASAPQTAPAPVAPPVKVVTPPAPPTVSAPAATPAAAPEPAAAVPAPAPAAAPIPAAAPAPEVPPPAPAPSAPAPSVASAPVTPPAPEPAGTPGFVRPAAGDGVYTLKVGDGVQVYLRGIPGAELIEELVDEQGMVTLPYINDIQAAGMSASDLERNIRQTYLDQDIYRNITVTVMVPTRFYFIEGEIRGPGRFQIMSATRVSQAIAAAGGYTEYASGQVLIWRGGKILKNIRNARRLDRKPEDDILLEPDDRIEVKRSLW